MLSVSRDTDQKKWRTAILKDKMEWTNGISSSALAADVFIKYSITTIPAYFLISPEGNVVMKNVGGDFKLIEEDIKKYLNILQ